MINANTKGFINVSIQDFSICFSINDIECVIIANVSENVMNLISRNIESQLVFRIINDIEENYNFSIEPSVFEYTFDLNLLDSAYGKL